MNVIVMQLLLFEVTIMLKTINKISYYVFAVIALIVLPICKYRFVDFGVWYYLVYAFGVLSVILLVITQLLMKNDTLTLTLGIVCIAFVAVSGLPLRGSVPSQVDFFAERLAIIAFVVETILFFKLKYSLKKILIVLIVISVVFSLFSVTDIIEYRKLDDYIVDLNIVYTPDTVAKKVCKKRNSVEVFDYWFFELDKDEKAIIENEIISEKWMREKSGEAYEVFSGLFRNADIENVFYDEYICVCIYDFNSEKKITPKSFSESELPEQAVAFLYNENNGNYVCCYWRQ